MAIKHPPRFIEKLIKLVCREELVEEILGDLFEYYQECAEQPGLKRFFLYFFHALHFMRPRLLRRWTSASPFNFVGRFQLNLRTSIRSMLRNKVVGALSLMSLVVGAVCFQMVNAWLLNEHSMDLFHEDVENIHLMTTRMNPKTDWAALDVAGILGVDYAKLPEIKSSTRIHAYHDSEIKFKTEGVTYTGKGLVVDSTFLSILTFPVQKGNKLALNDPNSIILTSEYANRIFGDEDPIGKRVDISCDQQGSYQVAAILKEIPSNSSITFDFLIPRHSKRFWRRMPQK